MTLTYRFAGETDVPAVVALIESAYRGETSRQGWTSEAHLLDGQRTDATAVLDVVRAAGNVMLVAEATDRLIGCCHLERQAADQVYFGMFAVQPGQQGRGLGAQILQEAERLACFDWSAATMLLTVIAQRPELIAWYERRGYRRTGETKPFPYGNERLGLPRRPDLNFVVLAKSLSQRQR